MNYNQLTNPEVRKAIEALENNDKAAWYALFTDDAIFTDDGNKGDFRSFFENAFDKKEKFLDIQSVKNEGLDIRGDFYAGQWGTFLVYFNFKQNEKGKFTRLDIGQVSKLK